MLVAAVVRSIGLNQQLWYDEITTLLDSVRHPLAAILTTYTSQNQHTLYSILARGSIVLLGEQPWKLRLPAVLFGVASIPALYFCARLWTTQREALLGSALVVVSYHHVWFSQNARGYTGMVFWTLLGTSFFILGTRQARLAPWVGYGVVIALGMYTHLTMGLVAAGHGLVYLWLLLTRRRELGHWPRNGLSPLIGFTLAGVLALVLYAPVLGQLFHRTMGQAGPPGRAGSAVQSEWTNPLWMVRETLRGLRAGAGGVPLLREGVLVAGGPLLLTGLGSYWRANRYVVGLIALPGIVTAAVMLVLEHNLWPRFFFFAIGFGLLLLVRGAMVWGELMARLGRRPQAGLRPAKDSGPLAGESPLKGSGPQAGVRWGTALVAVMLLGSAFSLRSVYLYPKQDFVGAMEFVEANRQPGEPVVTAGLASLPYQRYYGRNWPAVATRAQLEAVRATGRPAWLLYTLPVYVRSRQPEVWNAIQTEFTTVRVFRGTIGDGEIYVCKAKGQ
jgi:hypothetical protein